MTDYTAEQCSHTDGQSGTAVQHADIPLPETILQDTL